MEGLIGLRAHPMIYGLYKIAAFGVGGGNTLARDLLLTSVEESTPGNIHPEVAAWIQESAARGMNRETISNALSALLSSSGARRGLNAAMR